MIATTQTIQPFWVTAFAPTRRNEAPGGGQSEALDAAEADEGRDVRFEAQRPEEMGCTALGWRSAEGQEHGQSEQHQRIPVVVEVPPAAPDAEEKRHDQQRPEQRQLVDVVARFGSPVNRNMPSGAEHVHRVAVR